MSTYTIVDKDQDPLGPNEINAGGTISVSDGDVFIVDPSANENITFAASGGSPADFDIQVTGSNANNFTIKVENDLTTNITIGDNVDLGDIDLDLKAADAATVTAGNDVSLGQFEGSVTGPNSVVIGDGFTTDQDWKLGDADDTLTVGNDATFKNLDAGDGDDTVTFGDRATVQDFDTKGGNDSVTFGDDLDGHEVKTSDGNDSIRIGKNAQVDAVDGGGGNDVFYTETAGLNEKNVENSQVVCYAPGTLIDTPTGQRAIETLRVGDLVETLDAGPCPLRWLRSSHHLLDDVAYDDRPVLIHAGALGHGRPDRHLIVSPQHRILVGEGGQFENAFDQGFLVPAKALTVQPGIRFMRGKSEVTWMHFALERHHVVRANSCYAESLFLGSMVARGLTPIERLELEAIFGTIPQDGSAMNGPAARPFLRVGPARRQMSGRPKSRGDLSTKKFRKWDRDLAMEKFEAERRCEAQLLDHAC